MGFFFRPKGDTKKFTTMPFPQAKQETEQLDFRNVLGRNTRVNESKSSMGNEPEQLDFRRVLNRRGGSSQSSPSTQQQHTSPSQQNDFRQVLSRNVHTKSAKTVDYNKPAADQLDFRNVLSRKTQTRERPKVCFFGRLKILWCCCFFCINLLIFFFYVQLFILSQSSFYIELIQM